MFLKRKNHLITTDESTGTLVNFDWMATHGTELTAYERGGIRYFLDSQIAWLPPDRSNCVVRVSLKSVRQQQLAGPQVPPVSQELREQIAADLKAAADALGFVCEISD